jgi:hypothetical protein
MFVRDSEAETLLLGMDLSTNQSDKTSEENFVEVDQLGILMEIVQSGQALGIAAPGGPGGGNPRAHTAVALSTSVELFVLDHAAVSEVLSSERDGIPSGIGPLLF